VAVPAIGPEEKTAGQTSGGRSLVKQNLLVGIVVVLFLLVVLGASPFFILDLTQTAIVVQLGKPKRTVTEPGLKFKLPFVQEVRYFDKRLLDYDVPAREVITQDKKTILIDNFAKWKIVDPLRSTRRSKRNGARCNGWTTSSIPNCAWNWAGTSFRKSSPRIVC